MSKLNKYPMKHPHRKLKKQERWNKRGFPRPLHNLCNRFIFDLCRDCPFKNSSHCGPKTNYYTRAFHYGGKPFKPCKNKETF